jgi:hypothetical protein
MEGEMPDVSVRSGKSFLLNFANRSSKGIVRKLKQQRAARRALLQLAPAAFVRGLTIPRRSAPSQILKT